MTRLFDIFANECKADSHHSAAAKAPIEVENHRESRSKSRFEEDFKAISADVCREYLTDHKDSEATRAVLADADRLLRETLNVGEVNPRLNMSQILTLQSDDALKAALLKVDKSVAKNW